jgi:hypothetical protein
MSVHRRRPFVLRASFAIPCAAILILWCASYGRPRGVSYFSRDGTLYNVTIADGGARFQSAAYPRASPAFAGAESSIGWHAITPDPAFPEPPAHNFCGVTSGYYTAPMHRQPSDKSGVHWSDAQFIAFPFWTIAGLFAVMVAICLFPGRRTNGEARAASRG